jgi:hypothetical protein
MENRLERMFQRFEAAGLTEFSAAKDAIAMAKAMNTRTDRICTRLRFAKPKAQEIRRPAEDFGRGDLEPISLSLRRS